MGKKPNGYQLFLAIAGVAALVLYVLACRPSWSPDDRKILYPYFSNEGVEQVGVALYDLKTGVARSIFVKSPVKDGLTAQWESDGSRAIVTIPAEEAKEKSVEILLVPIESVKPARAFTVSNMEASESPYPEIHGNLILSSGEQLVKVNLETGETASAALNEGEVQLMQRGQTIFYAQKISREKEASRDKPKQPGGETQRPKTFDVYVIGTLNPDELKLHPLFEIGPAELSEAKVTSLGGFLTISPQGSPFALIAEGADHDSLVLFSEKGILKTITPDFGENKTSLGNTEWAPNGKTIYAAVWTKGEKTKQLSVGEIPVDGGAARLIPVAKSTIGSDESLSGFQIALSRDGTRIAVSTGLFDKDEISPADRGLFLIDLRDPKRSVKKTPLPMPQTPPAKAKE
jgi:hypothetical protein